MPQHFELLSRQVTPSDSRPQITIQRRGTLAINCAAFEALNFPTAAELLFDVDHQILGLRSIVTTAVNAYPVRGVSSPPVRHLIDGAAFTKHHCIATDIARRWYAALEEAVLFIDLTTPAIDLSEIDGGYGRSTISPQPRSIGR